MTKRWAVCLSDQERPRLASSLAPLRLVAGIELLAAGETIWLSGPADPDEALDAALRTLPGDRFTISDDAQLIPIGRSVPQGYLPTGQWMPLRQWFGVCLPAAAYAAEVRDRVRLRLVRGGSPSEANVLLTTHALWRDYACSAPQIRLQGLRFAASQDEVIVQGTPLPPVPGSRLVAHDGVAIPAGWIWSPAVDPAVLRTVFGIADGELALWREDTRWTRLRQDDFVHATRSAARLLSGGGTDA